MTATQETTNNVRGAKLTSALAGKEAKERERRRKKYKFALVRWEQMDGWKDTPIICVEYKKVLATWWAQSHTVLCDDQPEKVLRAMLRMMKENEDEI